MKYWADKASCKGMDINIFFPETFGDQQKGLIWAKAKEVCLNCPVKLDCLKSELANEAVSGRRNGVWGGLTPKERDVFVRTNPPAILDTKKP